MKGIENLTDALYQQMIGSVPATVKTAVVQRGPYFYYSRMDADHDYPVLCRKRAQTRQTMVDATEEILMDFNQRAQDIPFYSVTITSVSPDHTKLAFLENHDGTDRYTLKIRDLLTGIEMPIAVENVFLHDSLAWGPSSADLYLVTVDDTQRPHQVWYYKLDSTEAPLLLFTENDSTAGVALAKSQSGRFVFIKAQNKETDDVYAIDLHAREVTPVPIQPKLSGIKYDVEHWNKDFLIMTNRHAPNFRLQKRPIDDPDCAPVDLVAPSQDRYLESVIPFQNALFIEGREGGLTQIWVYQNNRLARMSWDEALYSVHLVSHQAFEAEEILIEYESFITPKKIYGWNVSTSHTTVVQTTELPAFDSSLYQQERLWTTARDGTQVPVSVVYRADMRRDPAPLILYGYGSYGISVDPDFNASILPLLDRGVIFSVAHVRGGAEMGYSWYQDGKFLRKKNTFNDFIDVGRDLIDRNLTSPDLMAAVGRSAGGLLIGAVINQAPQLFKVAVAGVPFVDVVTTMLDDTIPLTSLEWDEWGNPQDTTYYHYMKSYSPYDNVTSQEYPHLLAVAGINDPRVGFWEPAKWIARLRRTKTDHHTILLRTHMSGGHAGSSGRYGHLQDLAQDYAFVLDKLGFNS